MNRIEKITIILANLVTVIQKRGDYNLDEYSNKIAALYSSQEPKVVCPTCNGTKVIDVYVFPKACPDCSGTGKVSQSVSTPTEGMELSEDKIREYIKRITINHYYFIYPAGNWETKDDTAKIQWEMETEYWVKPILLEIRDNIARAQIAKVLSNLPTEQTLNDDYYGKGFEDGEKYGRESERKEIGFWLENETRGVNFGAWAYWWQSVIAKLKSGQSPKEG